MQCKNIREQMVVSPFNIKKKAKNQKGQVFVCSCLWEITVRGKSTMFWFIMQKREESLNSTSFCYSLNDNPSKIMKWNLLFINDQILVDWDITIIFSYIFFIKCIYCFTFLHHMYSSCFHTFTKTSCPLWLVLYI